MQQTVAYARELASLRILAISSLSSTLWRVVLCFRIFLVGDFTDIHFCPEEVALVVGLYSEVFCQNHCHHLKCIFYQLLDATTAITITTSTSSKQVHCKGAISFLTAHKQFFKEMEEFDRLSQVVVFSCLIRSMVRNK